MKSRSRSRSYHRSRSTTRSRSKSPSGKQKLKLLKIIKSDKPDKKYAAYFSDGTVTHFGAKGYQNYGGVGEERHLSEERKKRYLARHKNRENWNDPKTPGSLSRWILWHTSSFRENVREFKKRFNL
jgi:hypothetical protein